MNNKTLVVSLYGGPGTGKSTMTSRVFAELKDLGINCEIASEYAKDITWQKSYHVLSNQLYIFAKQQHRIWRLDGQVDVILTDSPLLSSVIYASSETSPLFKQLVYEECNKRPKLDIFLKRVKPYNPSGRSQTEDEAKELDELFHQLLPNFDLEVNGEKESSILIVEKILETINKLK
jgi:tRNA uridine 5-carbamoylmethylation protein Kti12